VEIDRLSFNSGAEKMPVGINFRAGRERIGMVVNSLVVTEMHTDSPDAWEAISELLRSTESRLESDLAFCRDYPPDPGKHPATTALLKEYVKRVEILLDCSRRGADGMKYLAQNHPYLTNEIQEIEGWIKRRKPNMPLRSLSEEDQDALGDWLIKYASSSYSKARQFVSGVAKSLRPKGAPSKRVQTLKILDARLANGWSYSMLASKMCDCDAKVHNSYCSERIRKRLKELESVLSKYGIHFKPADSVKYP